MEEQSCAINIKNRAQIISLTEALVRKTFSFEGTQESNLFSFHDYLDASTLYRFPLNSVSIAVKQIVALQSANTFNQRHTAIFNRHPRKCQAQQAELLNLYENLSENDVYWLAIESFKTYYEQRDLVAHSKKDEKRNLTQIKENRRIFFAALGINDVDLFKSIHDAQLTKKPFPPFLVSINKGILLVKKKGQDIIDSPENSDDDNMPDIPESEKNDVSEIIARLEKLNHGD
jgi:hypothetical protein